MDILSIDFFVSVVIGTIIGGLINVTGVGGGVMIIPSLVLIAQMPITVAVGTASWFSTITKVASSFNHVINKSVNWQTCLYFLLGSVPMTLIFALLVVYIIQNDANSTKLLQEVLRYITISVMILSAILIFRSKLNQEKPRVLSKKGLIISGGLVGVIMALTGVGGGVLIIPALVFFSKNSMSRIVSCSIVIAVILSLLTGTIYAQGGQIDSQVLIGLLLGSAIGVPLSNLIRQRISNELLTRLVLALIVLSAILMLISPLLF